MRLSSGKRRRKQRLKPSKCLAFYHLFNHMHPSSATPQEGFFQAARRVENFLLQLSLCREVPNTQRGFCVKVKSNNLGNRRIKGFY